MNFEVYGGKKLSGEIVTGTAKNSAVGLLCASLLNKGTTTLKNMPRIEEVHRILEVLHSIGVKTEWKARNLVITPPETLDLASLDDEAARRTRTIIMFIGPLLHHFDSFKLPQSGGCKLGSRTVRPHFFALENNGVTINTTETDYEISHTGLHGADYVLYETGDTVTENAVMAAALIPEKTTIRFASPNYMVQDVCHFLIKCGVTIEGIGTHTLKVTGVKEINQDIEYTVGEDPTDAMFFIATSIVTGSELLIRRVPLDFLQLELLKLQKMGLKYEKIKEYTGENGSLRLADIKILPSNLKALEEKIEPRPYPGLNIDNLPFFAVIATQAEGETLIHDWVYEKRAIYYTELDKLGAETELLDPHRLRIKGKTAFKPTEMMCPPALRPATILLIAMLAADGHSVLRNVYSINRGYEDIVNRLNGLGADVRILKQREPARE